MRRMTCGAVLLAAAAAVGCSGPSAPPGEAPGEATNCWVRPAPLTAEDRKSALPHDYPPQLREGLSDEQLARELELRVWAFDFAGKPLWCWLEIEEVGQATVPPREPAPRDGEWVCGTNAGHVVFSVGHGASERMQKIMDKIGRNASPDAVAFTLRFRSTPAGRSGSFGRVHDDYPLWFGWPEKMRKFDVQTPTVENAREGEALTLLRVECVEAAPAEKEKPRKVTLVLKGSFGKPRKD